MMTSVLCSKPLAIRSRETASTFIPGSIVSPQAVMLGFGVPVCARVELKADAVTVKESHTVTGCSSFVNDLQPEIPVKRKIKVNMAIKCRIGFSMLLKVWLVEHLA